MKRMRKGTKHKKLFGACCGVVVGSTALVHGQSVAPSISDTNRVSKLEQENQDLQQRLKALEDMAKKEGFLPSGDKSDPPVSAMSEIMLSGFVTTSFFNDSSDPPGYIGPRVVNGVFLAPVNLNYNSPGYLWNRQNDAFTLNKIKVTIASPAVQNNGDKFDVGYRVSLIAGQDAPYVDTSSGITGFDYIREAYIEFNVPIGNGLDIRAGEMISMLNYESGDGGAVNANFSQGFQWYFTGNPPGEGVQLGYQFVDWLGARFRVQNSTIYNAEVETTTSKTLMGSLDFKPMDKLWFSLLGFGGPQYVPYVQSLWGASFLGGWHATEQLGFGTELDYWDFNNVAGYGVQGKASGNSPVWSTGLWTTFDFNKQFELGLRFEFLSDKNGVDAAMGGVGAPLMFLNPVGVGQDLTSVALTLTYKPMANVRIQPEIRYDHTSWSGGFVPGKQDRLIYGIGVSYLF